MQTEKKELEQIRREEFSLERPTVIEEALAFLFTMVKTKKRQRPGDWPSTVEQALKIVDLIEGNKSESMFFYLMRALREIDKKKTRVDAFRLQCSAAATDLECARRLSEMRALTSNEKKLLEAISKLVLILVRNKTAPGDY